MKVLLALSVFCSISCFADDIYVISNGANLSDQDLVDIYTGDRQMLDGVKVVPLDNTQLQAEFIQKMLNMDVNRYRMMWTKKSFRDGLNPPAIKTSDFQIISIVKRTPGAIGYVSNVTEGVTVIKKL